MPIETTTADDHETLSVAFNWRRFGSRNSSGIGPIVFRVYAVVLSLLPALIDPVGWALTGPAWLALGWLAVRHLRQRLVMTHLDVRVRGWRREVSLDAATLIELRDASDADSSSGRIIAFVGQHTRVEVPVTSADARQVVAFARRTWPDVAIDPVAPWVDRFGEWHGIRASLDPVEELQTMRTASVGLWHVEVRITERDGVLHFQAVAHTRAGAPGLIAGEVRTSLDDAEADGVRIVEELRRTS